MAALLCLVAIAQAQTNVLRVEAVETPAGKALILPIVMENQSDVTGVQFDLDAKEAIASRNGPRYVFVASRRERDCPAD